jgi:hypothetical protein
MSIFVSKKELEEFTGCKTPAAQILAMKHRRIKHFENDKGPVLTRVEHDRTPAEKRPTDVIPSEQDIRCLAPMPRNGVGIYFLFDGKEIVYIGKTTNLFGRIGSHTTGEYVFDSIRFLPVKEKDLDVMEREYIARFKPKYNKMHNKQVADAEELMRV